MPTVQRTVTFYKCSRCDHEWYPRADKPPRTCPNCKSPYWDQERRVPKAKAEK